MAWSRDFDCGNHTRLVFCKAEIDSVTGEKVRVSRELPYSPEENPEQGRPKCAKLHEAGAREALPLGPPTAGGV